MSVLSITDSPRRVRATYLTLGLAVLAVLVVLSLAFTAADPFFLAPFRESQTAISAEYLNREPAGGMLAYQLPVLGAPWRLPFEFPLHQQLTAYAARTGIGIAQAGRVVSLICFAGCLWVGYRLLQTWGVPGRWLPVGIALLAASPVQIVYATSHMIESLALLAALIHLWAAWRFSERASPGWWGLALVGGVLVALVKITTWLSVAAILGLLFLHIANKTRRERGLEALMNIRLLSLALLLLIPLLAGLLWSKWCAQIRSANALSETMMDARSLNQWVFGTLAMRLSVKNWLLVAVKHLLLLFGPAGVLVPWLLVRAWRKGCGLSHSLNRIASVCLAGYFVHTVLLLRLHLRHDYYVYGGGVFLLVAVVCALIVTVETAGADRFTWLAPLLAMSMGLCSVAYITAKRGYQDLAAEEAVRALSKLPDEGAIVTYGLDWSPRVAYAVGRKALMLSEGTAVQRALPAILESNRDTKFAAIVVLGGNFDKLATEMAERIGLDGRYRAPFWANGYLLLPTNSPALISRSSSRHPVLDELARRVPPRRNLGNGMVYLRHPLSSQEGDWLEVVIKRDADAFFYRSHGHSLVRVRGYFSER